MCCAVNPRLQGRKVGFPPQHLSGRRKSFCELVPAPDLCASPGPQRHPESLFAYALSESQEWLEESDSEEDSSSEEEGAEGEDEDQEEDSAEDNAEEGAGESHSQMQLCCAAASEGGLLDSACFGVGPGRLPV